MPRSRSAARCGAFALLAAVTTLPIAAEAATITHSDSASQGYNVSRSGTGAAGTHLVNGLSFGFFDAGLGTLDSVTLTLETIVTRGYSTTAFNLSGPASIAADMTWSLSDNLVVGAVTHSGGVPTTAPLGCSGDPGCDVAASLDDLAYTVSLTLSDPAELAAFTGVGDFTWFASFEGLLTQTVSALIGGTTVLGDFSTTGSATYSYSIPTDPQIAIPEPTTLALFTLGLLGIASARRRETI